MRRINSRLPLLLVAIGLSAGLPFMSRAQISLAHPAFTLHSRITRYGPSTLSDSFLETRYVGAGGYSRVVRTYPDGRVEEGFDGPNLPLSGEELRASPQFVRTELLLGLTAYVQREVDEKGTLVADIYRVPEAGAILLKTVLYGEGERLQLVSEPLSISFGEPDAAQLKEEEARVAVSRRAMRVGPLNEKVLEKPEPKYPVAAQAAGVAGTVTVTVVVNEEGVVEKAEAISGPPPLWAAAVEAAYKARFTPTKHGGRIVKVKGEVTYTFAPQ